MADLEDVRKELIALSGIMECQLSRDFSEKYNLYQLYKY